VFEDGVLEMLSSIENQGYYIGANLVSSEVVASLRVYMDMQYEHDQFKKAGIGKGASLVISENIRKDSILWIDRQPKNTVVSEYLAFL